MVWSEQLREAVDGIGEDGILYKQTNCSAEEGELAVVATVSKLPPWKVVAIGKRIFNMDHGSGRTYK